MQFGKVFIDEMQFAKIKESEFYSLIAGKPIEMDKQEAWKRFKKALPKPIKKVEE